MMDTDLLTFEQAQEATQAARLDAVQKAIQRTLHAPLPNFAALPGRVIAAYEGVERVPVSMCPDMHPEFGRCAEFYGHEGTHWTHEYNDERRPDGSHPHDF